MLNLQTKTVALESLSFDSANVRKHDQRNVEAIKASLERFGQRKPIVVRGGTVIAGNGTLQAAIELGWNEIVVTEAPKDWNDDDARAYAVADNRTGELADWDAAQLAEQLMELPDELRIAAGFTPEDLGLLLDDWDSDMEAMERIEASDSVAKGKLVVTFEEKDREQIREALTNCIDDLGIEGVDVG